MIAKFLGNLGFVGIGMWGSSSCPPAVLSLELGEGLPNNYHCPRTIPSFLALQNRGFLKRSKGPRPRADQALGFHSHRDKRQMRGGPSLQEDHPGLWPQQPSCAVKPRAMGSGTSWKLQDCGFPSFTALSPACLGFDFKPMSVHLVGIAWGKSAGFFHLPTSGGTPKTTSPHQAALSLTLSSGSQPPINNQTEDPPFSLIPHSPCTFLLPRAAQAIQSSSSS